MTAPKLLLVEDDIFIGLDMADTLSGAGYQPTHRQSLAEARDSLGAERFDGVVLDYRVGVDDTLDFAMGLLASGQRLMFCTGSAPDEVQLLVRGVEVVGKPFTERQLLDAVSRMLGDGQPPLAA